MSTLTFVDTHNMVTFLAKPAESDGFHEIIDFIQALIDKKKVIITETSIRSDLHLEDAGGSESWLHPYHFNYPERCLTMEEMLNKFIDEGKREHEEMRAFIYDFQTNNELLLKERNNSLIRLRFGVQELLNVIKNVPMIDGDVKGVVTRGGKATTLDIHDNDTNMLPKEPVVVEPENPVESNKDLTNDQPELTSKPVVQPANDVNQPIVPFPKRLRKEKDEAQQKKFLENLKQLHINLPFIEALAQTPKYAKFLKVDLGASISLMPYTMYKKLGLGEPKATRMSLELADRKDEKNESDSEKPIRRIDSINTSYPVAPKIAIGDNVKSEHLYSASANEIDEKKPELKNLPQHLEYAYLHEDKSFPIIISSKLSENEKTSLLQVLERRKGAIA
ncbi:hypothetical protein Tco_0641238 [Tanacetum coccineum]